MSDEIHSLYVTFLHQLASTCLTLPRLASPCLVRSHSEQYRDLISAADAIVSMKKAANAVQSKFDLMHNACEVDIIHQKATKIQPGNEDSVDSECSTYFHSMTFDTVPVYTHHCASSRREEEIPLRVCSSDEAACGCA
jgi:hypothetical protein